MGGTHTGGRGVCRAEGWLPASDSGLSPTGSQKDLLKLKSDLSVTCCGSRCLQEMASGPWPVPCPLPAHPQLSSYSPSILPMPLAHFPL